MVKVEPKVHFANERTFLSWMHMSVSARSRMRVLACSRALGGSIR